MVTLMQIRKEEEEKYKNNSDFEAEGVQKIVLPFFFNSDQNKA